MSRLEKLAIRGIRSFNPLSEIKIEFFHPLTLIQGHNGSGKTTIIECLKMATCGSLPPLSSNGKTFINDPKISSTNETKASIKLKFLTPKDKEVIVVRNFQLSIKTKKYEFKRLEQLIKSYNQNGDLVTINSSCLDIDRQIPLLMHASKAILENVIFCHQEEINWPFSEAGNLKKVFDEIFNTSKYSKFLVDLKETNKKIKAKSKDIKVGIELMKKDYEHFSRLDQQIQLAETKVIELTSSVTELQEAYQKSSVDLNQILELEKNFKDYENGIVLAKAKKAEKMNQISTIVNDPMFQDYTSDEASFQTYCNSYQIQAQSDTVPKTNLEKSNNLEASNKKMKQLSEELNQLDANVISKQQIFSNYLLHKDEMIKSLRNIEDIDLNKLNDCSFDKAVQLLKEKEVETIEKSKILEEKKKEFEAKVSEKINDTEVNKHLYESKAKEIEDLRIKMSNILRIKSTNRENTSKISDIEREMQGIKKQIEALNYDIKKFESNKLSIENSNSQMTLRRNAIKKFDSLLNSSIVAFHLEKLKEACEAYYINEQSLLKITSQISQAFKSTIVINKKSLLKSVDNAISFLKSKRQAAIEEKQKNREQNLIVSMEIDQTQSSIKSITDEIALLTNQKQSIVQEIKALYNKLNVPLSKSPLSESKDDLTQIFLLKSTYEANIANDEVNYNNNMYEIKYLKEYIEQLSLTNTCYLCENSLDNEVAKGITKHKEMQIALLESQTEVLFIKLRKDKEILCEIQQSDSKVAVLKKIIDDLAVKANMKKEFESKLSSQLNRRKLFDDTSKEKGSMISEMNQFLEGETIDDIVKLKAKIAVTENNIIAIARTLLFPEEIIAEHDIEKISNMGQSVGMTIKEILSIEESLSQNEAMILQLNQAISSEFQKANDLNKDLRRLENERSDLIKYSNEKETAQQIDDLTKEIDKKEKEKEVLQSESVKLNELKAMLLEKKEKFDALYYSKTAKYRSIQEKIANWRMKNDYIQQDFNRIIESVPEIRMIPEGREANAEDIFKNAIEALNQQKHQLTLNKQFLEQEIRKYAEESNVNETEQKQRQMRDNIFKNNQMLFKIKAELVELDRYILSHENKLKSGTRLIHAKETLVNRNHELWSNYNQNLGKLEELKSYLSRVRVEIQNPNYKDINNRFLLLKAEFMRSQESSKKIEYLYESIDQSLLKYHGKRMEEINKLINHYWAMTYKGEDIKKIEIRSDFEKTGRSRNYNYRIVFETTSEQELDMRGRCSAGQKVLASIIIRLALAETFCNHCGILCLDEPTTNLDAEHSRSLARSLREIIQSRSDDQNFQLVIITHDTTFVDIIGADFCDSYWEVSKNDKNASDITLKPISSLFKN